MPAFCPLNALGPLIKPLVRPVTLNVSTSPFANAAAVWSATPCRFRRNSLIILGRSGILFIRIMPVFWPIWPTPRRLHVYRLLGGQKSRRRLGFAGIPWPVLTRLLPSQKLNSNASDVHPQLVGRLPRRLGKKSDGVGVSRSEYPQTNPCSTFQSPLRVGTLPCASKLCNCLSGLAAPCTKSILLRRSMLAN